MKISVGHYPTNDKFIHFINSVGILIAIDSGDAGEMAQLSSYTY